MNLVTALQRQVSEKPSKLGIRLGGYQCLIPQLHGYRDPSQSKIEQLVTVPMSDSPWLFSFSRTDSFAMLRWQTAVAVLKTDSKIGAMRVTVNSHVPYCSP